MDTNQHRQVEKLYLEMYDMLMAYGRSCTGSDALAEELIQETFRIACQCPEKLCKSPNPQGWLVVTMRNALRNFRATQNTARRTLEQYLLAQHKQMTVCEDGIRLQILYDDIAETDEFKLLTELAIDGRSIAEMAAARGISVSACKKRIQRARETLQKKLKNNVTFW